jgi:hypothetical protein
MGVGGQRHILAAVLLGERPGTHCQSEWVWKILTPPGFNPETNQPIAGRYTDSAIPAHLISMLTNRK